MRVGVLPGLPVGLYRVLQEQNEALLREYELYCFQTAADCWGGDPDGAARMGAASRARAHLATSALASIGDLPDSAHHDALITAPAADLEGFRHLAEVFTAAEPRGRRRPPFPASCATASFGPPPPY